MTEIEKMEDAEGGGIGGGWGGVVEIKRKRDIFIGEGMSLLRIMNLIFLKVYINSIHHQYCSRNNILIYICCSLCS